MFADVDGGVIVEADGALAASIEDLFREHARKQDRDAEKGLESDLPPPEGSTDY
jgi:hypothetical protein